MSQIATIEGLDPLIKQMEAYPVELTKTVAIGMSASLNTYWENVPPYPAPPANSKYRRTGTLGKSLGSGMGGGAVGEPSIYRIKKLGAGNFEGAFGSNLEYAPYVIGDTAQAEVHQGRWWTMETIAKKANDKVMDIWSMVMEKLARFLERKNG